MAPTKKMKIIQATIKTLDENNHVRIWNEKQIDLESVRFNDDSTQPKPKKEDSPPIPKEAKKSIFHKQKQPDKNITHDDDVKN